MRVEERLSVGAPLSAPGSVQTSLQFQSRRHCQGPRETCCRPKGQLLSGGTWGWMEEDGKLLLSHYAFHVLRKSHFSE